MSALEKFITEVFGEYGIPTFDIGSPFRQLEDDARAELAVLRAELASHELIQAEAERFAPELARQISEIEQERDALRATVAAQARRLTEIQTECDDWHTLAMEEAAALEYIVKMVDEDVSDEVVIRHMYHAAKSALAANAPAQTEAAQTCEVCEERAASVERDGHHFCGYCYGSYAAVVHGEEFAQMPKAEQKK